MSLLSATRQFASINVQKVFLVSLGGDACHGRGPFFSTTPVLMFLGETAVPVFFSPHIIDVEEQVSSKQKCSCEISQLVVRKRNTSRDKG